MGRSKGRSGVRDRDGPGAICMQNIETVSRGWGMVIKTPNLDNRSLPRSAIGEGNGTPLRYSCLENPTDGGAWWATYSPWGREESDTTEQLYFHFSLSCIGEGNGNPLQCSCLENPRDGGAC